MGFRVYVSAAIQVYIPEARRLSRAAPGERAYSFDPLFAVSGVLDGSARQSPARARREERVLDPAIAGERKTNDAHGDRQHHEPIKNRRSTVDGDDMARQ